MNVVKTALPDVILIEPKVFGDARGFFMESYNREAFAKLGIAEDFIQDNHSMSVKGVLRGLHFQHRQPQGKLVRVTRGTVYDVAVDLRRSSPTFGKWAGFELSAENKRMAWVPPGFAHGFYVMSPEAEFQYKVTAPYAPGDEYCLIWNDPALAIAWPLEGVRPSLSKKDAEGLPFGQIPTFA